MLYNVSTIAIIFVDNIFPYPICIALFNKYKEGYYVYVNNVPIQRKCK